MTTTRRGDWSYGPSLSGSTSAQSQPLEPETDETYAALSYPVTYQIDPFTVLSFGVSSGARAPHWSSENFRFRQFEALLFAGIAWAEGTSRRPAGWLL